MAYELADGSLSTDYKIGDKFVVVDSVTFSLGSVVSFYRDDKSRAPVFKLVKGKTSYECCDGKAGAYVGWKRLKPYKEETDVKYKIKLKQGDACEIKGLTEEQYHQVWDRFVACGAGDKFKRGNFSDGYSRYLNWWVFGNIVHTNDTDDAYNIYTYDQIMEQENNMNTFSKKDLKTGMKITVSNPYIVGHPEYIVLLDTVNGDFLVNTSENSYNPLHSIAGYGDILKVEVPDCPFNLKGVEIIWKTIWERPAKETPEQKAQRELQEQYDATKKQLEELGKKLGVV